MRMEPEEEALNNSLDSAGMHSTIAIQDAEIRCLKLERDAAQVKHCFSQFAHWEPGVTLLTEQG